MIHSLRISVCSLCEYNISVLGDGKVHFQP
jgi:hypothetical protein